MIAPLITYYGDDFTGSTDVMEALSSNGIETVLFTQLPDEAWLKRFSHVRAIGLAGYSRSKQPAWMDAELPAIFKWLARLGAPICHYKICSTFDSAPHQGSIGRAVEIGLETFGQSVAPIVVGAHQLGRYTFFGELFARFGEEVFRIDSHPVMSRHPATPMKEADLRRHLSHQTGLPIGLVDLPAIHAGSGAARLDAVLSSSVRAVLMDVADAESQKRVGQILWNERQRIGPFIIGSSGVEYALIEAWREAGIAGVAGSYKPLEPATRIAVVSGSCSPTTERQIRHASANGFVPVAVDYIALASGQGGDEAEATAHAAALGVLRKGASPLLYTALGHADDAGQSGPHSLDNDRVGQRLGAMLQKLAGEQALNRVIVAGGDTSSHALDALGVAALTLRHPIPQSPGSPVCLAHLADSTGSFEIVLKGGQVGKDDFFVKIRNGKL
ncbi:four-carbon acid sugar kinase family protein [Phyllobacterium salinisoli]|uniref:Four-carbon acid sugar kinase family protein n=1 Tax=Phyllobacterium salinisoli TaxID=1899321 RepID=A0A368K185_9HYPH|nr:four-carbon acid sugar kinase family protein [Phyllobacterium salinisoli]RCS22981.1 four-carbon acid sugar kinase family protein [Phyllobacterium salinisoli]